MSAAADRAAELRRILEYHGHRYYVLVVPYLGVVEEIGRAHV